MRAKEARNIAIADFLASLDIKPIQQRAFGQEFWYQSPIRNGDHTPSFKVDVLKNLRFDFGLAKGGNIIDLVCDLERSTVKQALAVLEQSGLSPLPKNSLGQFPLFKLNKKVAGEKEKNSTGQFLFGVFEIYKKSLIDYLKFRKIDLAVAKNYLKQVHFKSENKPDVYYGLGFACGDGFEVRNKHFKGFVGRHKTISCLNLEDGKSLSVFEGFMDFLSFLSKHNLTTFANSVIILNSISLRKQALEKIKDYHFSKVYLFLDNDLPGKQTTAFFMENLKDCPVVDKSNLYQGYNDFNQMTMEEKTHD